MKNIFSVSLLSCLMFSSICFSANSPVLPSQGGTGQTTYTNGQILIGNTTGNTLAKATIAGTSNQITVTNGPGTITLSTPQSIAITSTPTFSRLTLSNSALAISGFNTVLNFPGTLFDGTYVSMGTYGREGIQNNASFFSTYNLDYDATNNVYQYIGNGIGQITELSQSGFIVKQAPSGTSGTTATPIAVMTIGDSSGNTRVNSGYLSVASLTPSQLISTDGSQNFISAATTVQTLAGLTLTGLTTSSPVFTNGSNALSSSGTVPVLNGGTGQTTYTNGQILIGNTTGNTLAKATIAGTTNQVTVTNGPGTITLSTPQNINTTATPTFSGLTLSSPANITSILSVSDLSTAASNQAIQKKQFLLPTGGAITADTSILSAGTTNTINSFTATDLILFTIRLLDGCGGGNDVDFAFYNSNFVALANRNVPGLLDRYMLNTALNASASSIVITRTVGCGTNDTTPLTVNISGSNIQAVSAGTGGNYLILNNIKYSTATLKNSSSFGSFLAGGLGGNTFSLDGILDYRPANGVSTIVSSVPVNLGPAQAQALTNALNIRGANSTIASATNWYTSTDQHPLIQILPYAHDNDYLSFDSYFTGSTWTSSSATGSFQIAKFSGSLNINYGVSAANSAVIWSTALSISNAGELSIPVAGKTITYKTGANACAGTGAVMVAGTVTVNTTCAKTNDFIQLMKTTSGGTSAAGMPAITIVNGTSFTITGGGLDTSTWSWKINHLN